MKVGDLVRVASLPKTIQQDWIGVVVAQGPRGGRRLVVVYWNDKNPAEVEYKDYLEVIGESR